jgi:hypothetical protein
MMAKWWETWALIAVVVLIVGVGIIFLRPITSTMVYPEHCPSAMPSGAVCL